ncbi:MAG: hypothetical protein ACE5DO_08315 [Desulfobacterales bacterium]
MTTTDHTEARIIEVRPQRLVKCLDQGKIVIAAGFQGVSTAGEITTLGRGGSDTTAVALGVALQAAKVEFYKDVPGIFEEDPKKNPCARRHLQLSYDEALEIVHEGSEVLHPRSIVLAKKNNLPLVVRSFSQEARGQHAGTRIHFPGENGNRRPAYEQESLHQCPV